MFGAASTFYRARPVSLQPTLTAQLFAGNTAMHLEIAGVDGVPYRLEFSNDLADWTTLVSNPFGGAMALDDWDVFSGPARFYRVVVPNLQPLLTILPQFGSGFRVYTESYGAQPFALQASTNLSDWSDVATNSFGGALDFSDVAALALPHRLYRVKILPARPDLAPPNPDPLVQFHLAGLPGVPYVVEISNDQINWTSLVTNALGGPLEFVDTQNPTSPHFYRVNYQTTGIRGTR